MNIIPMKRFGTRDAIKGIIIFLVSYASRNISGAKIVVDEDFTINIGI